MWRRFTVTILCATAGSLLTCWLAVLLVDPLGISPIRLPTADVLTEGNRRFMAPRVIRSGAFDSFLIGTSTVHHIAPDVMEAQLGGHFANTGTHGATPYEQVRMLVLILRQPSPPRMVVHGLDSSLWCAAEPPRYNPESRFPDWLYDDSLPQHLAYSLNARMLTLVSKRLMIAAGVRAADLTPAGFHNDLPDDATWDEATVTRRIWGAAGPQPRDPDPLQPAEGEIGSGSYPALDMLTDVLTRAGRGTAMVFALMPVHLTSLPERSSERAHRLSGCKARLAEVAGDRAVVLDYLRPSGLTLDGATFWDNDHTRIGFGPRFASDIKAALTGKSEAADGVWSRLGVMEARHAHH